MNKKDELLVNELFEMSGKYYGRTSELFVLAASNIQEKSKQIEMLESDKKQDSCTHKDKNSVEQLEYDGPERSVRYMHCILCGTHGSMEELTK